MKPWIANLINAVVLIIMGLWGYFSSEDPSATALIAPAFGGLFLLSTPLMQRDNKIAAHIVVLLTLLLIIALFMPLMGAIGRSDTAAIIRVGIMIASCVFAMVAFIQSFIAVRKARKAGQA